MMTWWWRLIPSLTAKRSQGPQIITTDTVASHKFLQVVGLRCEITTSQHTRNSIEKRIKVAPSKDSLSDILPLSQPNWTSAWTNNLKSPHSRLPMSYPLNIIQSAHRMCCAARATPWVASRIASWHLWNGTDTLRRRTTSAAFSNMTRTRSARVADAQRLFVTVVTVISFLHAHKDSSC